MVLSMGAVLASVAIILIITHRSHQQVLPPVDFAGAVALAQTQTQLPIEVPTPLPSGYVVTSARFEPESYGATGDVRWYLGYQTPGAQYVSLWQSTGPAARVVAGATDGAACNGSVVILKETWQTCQNPKPLNRALVRVQGRITTVVSGTASFADLKAFAGTLQPPTK